MTQSVVAFDRDRVAGLAPPESHFRPPRERNPDGFAEPTQRGARPRRRRLPLRLLEVGALPYLLAVDVCMLALASTMVDGEWALETAALLTALAMMAAGGLYWPRLTLSALDDLPAIAGRVLFGAACTEVIGVTVLGHASHNYALMLFAVWGAALVVFGRAIAYQSVMAARRRGLVRHRAIVVGAGEVGGTLARILQEHPEYGLTPVGFVDDEPLLPPEDRPVPLVGGLPALAQVVARLDIEVVLVAFTKLDARSLVQVVRTCDRLQCRLFFVPRFFELHYRSRDMDAAWGLPLVRLRRPAFRLGARLSKRLLDIAVAAAGLVLLSPILAACALAVLINSGRPVLFRQERVGLHGRTFRLFKFRSYRQVDEEESGTTWTVAGDPGLTRVGRILRRTSLDELPQLWNVLIGDMTLVGPRPERPTFVDQFSTAFPNYPARHRVPVGLTGWAQVHGLRGDTSIEDRAAFDNYYIENYSLWNDIKILLRTSAAMGRAAR